MRLKCVILVLCTTVSCGFGQTFDFSGCGQTKGCFIVPKGCKTDCSQGVSFVLNGTNVVFELYTDGADPTRPYVALGLSDDDNMGEDTVHECVYSGTSGKVEVFLSENFGQSNRRNNFPYDTNGLQLVSGSYNNGKLYCKFLRDIEIPDSPAVSLNGEYYLLVARGNAEPNTGHLMKHTSTPIVTDEPVDVQSIGITGGSADSNVLIQIHAALMIIAWVGFVSTGKVVARYYKDTWRSLWYDQKKWFQIHRSCMVTAFVCFTVSIIIIIISVGGWVTRRGDSFAHSIVGIVAFCFGFLQPFIALCRCHPGTPNRPFFNWIHWAFGTIAHILATVAIYLAFGLPRLYGYMPRFLYWIMTAYILFHVLVEVILEIHACRMYKKKKKTDDDKARSDGVITSPSQFSLALLNKLFYSSSEKAVVPDSLPTADEIQMRQIGKGQYVVQTDDRPKGTGFQKFMLAVYVVVIACLTIVLVVLVLLGLSKQFLFKMKHYPQ